MRGNNMTPENTVFISDFDGTITDDDFFAYTAKAYFDERALKPWREYLAGQKTHFEALREMFAQIRAKTDDLNALIDGIRLDPDLDAVWELCVEKGIKLFVCSAGNDYYIRRLLGNRLQKYGVTLISNKGEYSPETGLVMTAPDKNAPYYDAEVGISKYKLAKSQKDAGRFVIFAGDGPPDLAPARIADVVFARKLLLKKCLEDGIKTQKFNGFKDIGNYIERM